MHACTAVVRDMRWQRACYILYANMVEVQTLMSAESGVCSNPLCLQLCMPDWRVHTDSRAPILLCCRYEDMAEFEDALHGSFDQFISLMPHIETKLDDRGRLVRAKTVSWL